ncbi:MAG TPA: phosphoesterase [Candidatus Binatia bacterium]|nr:phosphoesterase [Candidatus Binatia bacterium]
MGWFRLSAAFLLALFLAVESAALAAPSLYDRELVRNGAAETDAGTTDPKAARPAVDWHPVAGFAPVLTLRYGTKGGFPRPDSPGASYHGLNFFWGGYTPRASAYQDIEISAIASDIDARQVQFKLSAWLGGREKLADHSTVSVTFLDPDGKNLGGAYVGPVTNADRGGVTSFQYREVGRLVPAGSRIARITIVMMRFEGESNDGYVDGISFFLHKSVVPAR